MKKPVKIAVFSLVLVAAAAGGARWWSGHSREIAWQQQVVKSLEHRPAALKPAEFRHRVEAAEDQVREGKEWREGAATLASMYQANGYTQQASELYSVLVRADASNPRWPDRLAGLYALYGQLDQAILLWGRTAEIEPGYLPAKLHLADALIKSNRHSEAAPIYKDVLAREAGNAYAVAGLAKIDIAAGNLIAARNRLEEAGVQAQVRIGENILVTVYEKLGETAKAEQIRGRAKSTDSYIEVPDPYMDEVAEEGFDVFRLALDSGSARRAGDPARAMRLLQRAIRIEPGYAISYFQLGLFLVEQGNVDAAKKAFRDAIERDPSYGDAWRQLIDILNKNNAANEADAVLDEGLRRCPDSPSLHYKNGMRLKAAGQVDEALAEFQLVAKLRPSEIDGLMESAVIYFEREQNDLALQTLKRALEIMPDNPLVISTLTMYYITSKDEPKAKEWYRRCLAQPRLKREMIDGLSEGYRSHFGHAP